MNNQPNEAAARIANVITSTKCDLIADGPIALGQAVLTAIREGWVPLPDDCPQITSLRSALANAEAKAEAMRLDAVNYCQQENEARAKLAEAEKERDLWKDAHGTHTERRYDEMVRERDAATAEASNLRGLLREVRESLTIKGAWMDVAEQLIGHDACNRIVAALTHSASDGWISISERLPETGTEVLAVFPCEKADTVFIALHDGMTWYDRDGNTFAMHPIWWQPLLTPPSDRSAEERS